MSSSNGLNIKNIQTTDIFCYNPEAAPGERFTVLANSDIRRFYHSTTLLIPDGRTLILGTDQATDDQATAFEHRFEAFTPPWLLNGTPRPEILRYCATIQLVRVFRMSLTLFLWIECF